MASQKLHRPKTGPVRSGGGASRFTGHSKLHNSVVKHPRPNSSAHPKTSFDRYLALARAAAASGDAVESENYLQHADHYFRLLMGKTA
jgi:hypothetical protein